MRSHAERLLNGCSLRKTGCLLTTSTWSATDAFFQSSEVRTACRKSCPGSKQKPVRGKQMKDKKEIRCNYITGCLTESSLIPPVPKSTWGGPAPRSDAVIYVQQEVCASEHRYWTRQTSRQTRIPLGGIKLHEESRNSIFCRH